MVEILLLFLDDNEFVQVEKHPSAGYKLRCVSCLTKHLETMNQKHDSNFVRALKRYLLVRMERYIVCETFIVASVLDPRFKRCSNEKRISAKSLLESKIMKHMSISQSSQGTQPAPDKETGLSAKRKRLFFFLDADNSDTSTCTEDECTKYLGEPCEPVIHWNFGKII